VVAKLRYYADIHKFSDKNRADCTVFARICGKIQYVKEHSHSIVKVHGQTPTELPRHLRCRRSFRCNLSCARSHRKGWLS